MNKLIDILMKACRAYFILLGFSVLIKFIFDIQLVSTSLNMKLAPFGVGALIILIVGEIYKTSTSRKKNKVISSN